MDKDLDTLLERMKPYLPIDGSASGIFVEELDLKLQQSRDAVMSIQDLWPLCPASNYDYKNGKTKYYHSGYGKQLQGNRYRLFH